MDFRGARPQRGPALVLAGIFLAYAVGKSAYAAQGRLGLPTGPQVPAQDYAKYADATLGVAENQWLAAATGLAGAALVLISISRVGRVVPRRVMLVVLGLAFVGFGAGAVVMIADGFVGLGIGWRWFHGVLGLVALTTFAATIRSYARASRTRGRRHRTRRTAGG